MKSFVVLSTVFAFLTRGSAYAVGSSNSPVKTDLEDMTKARHEIQEGNFKIAILLLKNVLTQQPDNADAWNMLAYSQRKSDDLLVSLENYRKALSIDSSHKDAHEYIGELYLRMGDLANAEKHLKILDKICVLSCEQFDELEEAISVFKKKRK